MTGVVESGHNSEHPDDEDKFDLWGVKFDSLFSLFGAFCFGLFEGLDMFREVLKVIDGDMFLGLDVGIPSLLLWDSDYIFFMVYRVNGTWKVLVLFFFVISVKSQDK